MDEHDGPLVPSCSDLHGIPTVRELVNAVAEFLNSSSGDGSERQMRYLTRVSGNVLGIVDRELQLGLAQEQWWQRALLDLGFSDAASLSAAIRTGEVLWTDGAVWRVLVHSVRAKLDVANPKYLFGQPSPELLPPPTA